jgi:hypothetical protein
MVKQVFVHSGKSFDTVGSYGVIDWGFEVVHQDSSFSPAGAILRQAHTRFAYESDEFNYNFLPPEFAIDVERTLRKYGITSAGDFGFDSEGNAPDFINIQGTNAFDLVDFGTFRAVSGFYRDVVVLSDTELEFTMDKDSDRFVQPDYRLQLPLTIWGMPSRRVRNFDLPMLIADRYSRLWNKGKISRDDVATMVGGYFIGSALAKWGAVSDSEILSRSHSFLQELMLFESSGLLAG